MHVEEKGMPVKNILQCCEASYCRIIPEPGSYMKKNVSYNMVKYISKVLMHASRQFSEFGLRTDGKSLII